MLGESYFSVYSSSLQKNRNLKSNNTQNRSQYRACDQQTNEAISYLKSNIFITIKLNNDKRKFVETFSVLSVFLSRIFAQRKIVEQRLLVHGDLCKMCCRIVYIIIHIFYIKIVIIITSMTLFASSSRSTKYSETKNLDTFLKHYCIHFILQPARLYHDTLKLAS